MSKDLRAAKNFTNRLGGSTGDLDWEDLDVAGAEASLTTPTKASALRVNGHVVLHGNPCKIVNMSTSKPGKHGHAKILFVGMDLFTGKKYEEICQSGHTMLVPTINKQEYIVVDMGTTGYLALMDDKYQVRHDLQVTDIDLKDRIAEELAKEDRDNLAVTVLAAMDKEMVISIKTGVK